MNHVAMYMINCQQIEKDLNKGHEITSIIKKRILSVVYFLNTDNELHIQCLKSSLI